MPAKLIATMMICLAPFTTASPTKGSTAPEAATAITRQF